MKRIPPLAVVLLTVFLDLLGFGLVIPLMPYFAAELGADGFEIGALTAIYSFAQFLFAPIWGRLSDRIGRRPVLLLSIAGTVVAMTAFGLSTSLAMLFAARAFAGIATANIGTAQACVADLTPPEQRAKGMGMVGAAIGMGFVLGPALGGLLARISLPAPALAAAALSAVNLLLALRFLPETLPPEARRKERGESRWQIFRESLGRQLLPLLLLLGFLATFAFSQLETTFVLFTEARFGYDPTANGWLFTFIGIVLALAQGGLVPAFRRRGISESRLLLAGCLLLVCGLTGLAFAGGLAGVLAGSALLAVGNGLQNPALAGLVSRQAGVHEQGRILGVSQSLSSLARVAGPLLGGATFQWGGARPGVVGLSLPGYSLPFFVASAILVVAAALSLRLIRLEERRQEQAAGA